MIFFEYIFLALKEIKAHKLESVLTILGIIIGVASVTLILSIGEGVIHLIKGKVNNYRENVLLISYSPERLQTSSLSTLGGQGESNNPLADILRMINSVIQTERTKQDNEWVVPVSLHETKRALLQCPYILDASFFSRHPTTLSIYEKTFQIMVVFSENNFSKYLKNTLFLGRNFSDYEIQGREPVAIIQLPLKEYQWFLQYGGVIGQLLTIEGRVFRVIGVMESDQSTIHVFVPYLFYYDLATLDDAPQFLAQIVSGGKSEEKIRAIFKWLHTFIYNGDFYREDADLGLFNQLLVYLPKITLLLSFIAGISLIVGGIGIMNSMLSSVMKRTREIGIRKSIGAKNYSMIIQFMIESILITSIGGFLGILLGIGSSVIVLRLFNLPYVFPMISVIYAVVLILIIGLASGIVPAVKASRLDPIDALGHT